MKRCRTNMEKIFYNDFKFTFSMIKTMTPNQKKKQHKNIEKTISLHD